MPTAEQQTLIDGVLRLLETEPRVEAAWLAGSLGAGAGDAFSDVDVLVLAADGTLPAVSAALAERLSIVAKPVLVNTLFGGKVLSVVTEDWGRFDLSLIEGDELERHDARVLVALFNRSGRNPPVQPDQPYRANPEQLLKLVQEFFRILGLAVVVVGREEYALALTGIDYLRRMTFDLMLEENGVPPSRRGGALHRNPLLTADQQQELVSVPPVAAERTSVIDGQRALAAIFLPRARKLAEEIGMVWPIELEDATRRSLDARLQPGML